MRTLLVASAGGHLQQLVELGARLEIAAPLWVTYDTVQTRSLLAGQTYVGAYHPTTKSIPNAIRNAILARRLLAEHDIDCVVSTGAAVAVPFISAARARRISCHYIESATRVTGPSLSGRILQAIPGVHLYRQMGSWGRDRWRPGPCVFDGFDVDSSSSQSVRSVLVSLGTHGFAFDRLLLRLVQLFAGHGVTDVVWQLGSTQAPSSGLPGRVETDIPWQDFVSLVESVDVVVGHAGTGLCLTALTHGKMPVVVPRRRNHGEHTDHHQTQIAAELSARGLVTSTEAECVEMSDLERAAGAEVRRTTASPFRLLP